ncbi:MAG: GHKL domain-containing protein [Treponema sp.]|nr:GHKL domain-containing protein [Treponema sp.]
MLKKIKDQHNALRIMKHDYKYHLNAALGMIRRGEHEKGEEYLALENAVEACQKLKAGGQKRRIELVIKQKGKQLAIMARNTFDGNAIMDGEQLVSTKKDGGIGLQSIRAVVDRYGDVFYTEYDDKWFSAFVFWTGSLMQTNSIE